MKKEYYWLPINRLHKYNMLNNHIKMSWLWNSIEDNRRLFSNKLMERYCLWSCWVFLWVFLWFFCFVLFPLKFGIQFRTSSKTTSILLLKNGQISYRYNTCYENVICLTENMIVKMSFKSLNWKKSGCLSFVRY